MDKESVVCIHNGDEWNYVICRKMDGTRDHHVKWNKPDEKDKYHMFPFMWNLVLKINDRNV
jgi:hypothetical protein